MTKTHFQYTLHKFTSGEKRFEKSVEIQKLFGGTLGQENMFYTVDHLKAKLREPSKLWRKILKSLMVLDIIYKTSKGYRECGMGVCVGSGCLV